MNGEGVDIATTSFVEKDGITSSMKGKKLEDKKILQKTKEELYIALQKLTEREMDFSDSSREEAYIKRETELREEIHKIDERLGLSQDLSENLIIFGTGFEGLDQRLTNFIKTKMDSGSRDLNLNKEELEKTVKKQYEEDLLNAGCLKRVPDPDTDEFGELLIKVADIVFLKVKKYRFPDLSSYFDGYLDGLHDPPTLLSDEKLSIEANNPKSFETLLEQLDKASNDLVTRDENINDLGDMCDLDDEEEDEDEEYDEEVEPVEQVSTKTDYLAMFDEVLKGCLNPSRVKTENSQNSDNSRNLIEQPEMLQEDIDEKTESSLAHEAKQEVVVNKHPESPDKNTLPLSNEEVNHDCKMKFSTMTQLNASEKPVTSKESTDNKPNKILVATLQKLPVTPAVLSITDLSQTFNTSGQPKANTDLNGEHDNTAPIEQIKINGEMQHVNNLAVVLYKEFTHDNTTSINHREEMVIETTDEILSKSVDTDGVDSVLLDDVQFLDRILRNDNNKNLVQPIIENLSLANVFTLSTFGTTNDTLEKTKTIDIVKSDNNLGEVNHETIEAVEQHQVHIHGGEETEALPTKITQNSIVATEPPVIEQIVNMVQPNDETRISVNGDEPMIVEEDMVQNENVIISKEVLPIHVDKALDIDVVSQRVSTPGKTEATCGGASSRESFLDIEQTVETNKFTDQEGIVEPETSTMINQKAEQSIESDDNDDDSIEILDVKLAQPDPEVDTAAFAINIEKEAFVLQWLEDHVWKEEYEIECIMLSDDDEEDEPADASPTERSNKRSFEDSTKNEPVRKQVRLESEISADENVLQVEQELETDELNEDGLELLDVVEDENDDEEMVTQEY